MKSGIASKICFICNYVKSHNVHNHIFVSLFRVLVNISHCFEQFSFSGGKSKLYISVK